MISVWQNTLDIPGFPSLDKDINTEVLIIGGGIAGILCAYKLKEAGVDYTLLEANEICKKTDQHPLVRFNAFSVYAVYSSDCRCIGKGSVG